MNDAMTNELPHDWSHEWIAPAKINLFLHVIGRRADGYHLLQTVFRFLDVGDSIRCEPREDGRIVLATPLSGVADENHLAVRAAALLAASASVAREAQLGVTLHVDKRLPLGGGLGGGSSDAATTLIALNHLWRTGLDRSQLKRLALTLGADVPIFIHGHTAFAEGMGELFTDVTPPPAWYLVLVPPVAVPTAQIFAMPDLRRDTPVMAASAWHSGVGHNDLEAVAVALYPEVARHLDWLRTWGDARMSGSGACCFATFDTAASAAAAHAALPSSMQGFVARGIDQHPLVFI